MAVYLRRGVAAGLLAGLIAGLVGLVLGEPPLQAAIDLEPASPGPPVGRGVQRIGLVVGNGLVGIGVGAVFGVAAAWALGRIAGDEWTRSLKLGAAAVAAMVLLPMVKYPALPPGAGDPDSVGLRTTLFLGLGLLGILLALIAWAAAHQLAGAGVRRAWRQVLVGFGLLTATVLVLVAAPTVPAALPEDLPAELLWSFRLGALATQMTLYGGTAVLFGLLSQRRSDRPRVLRS